MTNTVALILCACLLIDAAANVARLIAIEAAYLRQTKLMDRAELEQEARVQAAASVIRDVAEEIKREAKG